MIPTITPEILLSSSGLVFTVGTIFLLVKVLKERKSLKNYDLTGSFLTSFALLMNVIAYHELNYTSTVLLTLPTFSFWFIVTLIKVSNKTQQCGENING